MIRAVIAGLLLVALSAAVAFLLMTKGHEQGASPASSTGESGQARQYVVPVHSENGPRPAAAPAESPKDVEWRHYADVAQAMRAREALEAALRLGAHREGDARQIRLGLSGVCAPLAHSTPAPDDAIHDQLRRYCDGYLDSELAGMSVDDLGGFMSRDTTSSILALIDEGVQSQGRERVQEAIAILDDVIHFADSPWEVRAALQIASERGLTPAVVEQSLTLEEVRFSSEITWLVGEMSYCHATRGCRAGGMEALQGCLATNLCRPGMHYLQQLEATTSPVAYSAATRITMSLRNP